MKFHEWATSYDRVRAITDNRLCVSVETPQKYYFDVLRECQRRKQEVYEAFPSKPGRVDTFHQAVATFRDEWSWYDSGRPYFKVWPSIAKTLVDFPLKMRGDAINPPSGCKTILLRFPVSVEPVRGTDKDKMCLCLASYEVEDSQRIIGCNFRVLENDATSQMDTTDGFFYFFAKNELEIEFAMKEAESQQSKQRNELGTAWLRLAVAVALIADDPSIITPDVLSKDRDRYDRETDEAWKERAVERARRRGVVGWNVGADYEVCPHYRRPHFGIRYTGKSRRVPRIVPIKGAVVHRSKLTEVPTGYILPDGREVEP